MPGDSRAQGPRASLAPSVPPKTWAGHFSSLVPHVHSLGVQLDNCHLHRRVSVRPITREKPSKSQHFQGLYLPELNPMTDKRWMNSIPIPIPIPRHSCCSCGGGCAFPDFICSMTSTTCSVHPRPLPACLIPLLDHSSSLSSISSHTTPPNVPAQSHLPPSTCVLRV